MVFVADDLAAWLTGVLADAGRKKLTALVLGTEQEKGAGQGGHGRGPAHAAELCPGDQAQAAQLAMVVSEVFSEPAPRAPLAGHVTVGGAGRGDRRAAGGAR